MTARGREILLLILAVIFSVALMFAFIELPRWIDSVLQQSGSFPGFDQGAGEENAYHSELFIDALYLRWIGYGSLFLVLLFIVMGFLTRKSSWAWAGAFVLFLPVFGQFALSMFFLSGLGILRAGWLPFMETGFPVLNLGLVIYVPYWVLRWFFGLFNWYAHDFIAWLFMSVGAFLFVWGVFTWLQNRFGKSKISTNWLYRYSRHPQYLGWIIWSYGLMLFSLTENNMKKSWSIPNSLPWLLATMIILAICMLEELAMKKKYGERYEAYRKKTPFLFPLPKWLNKVLSYPMHLLTGGGHPRNRKQVAATTVVYTFIFMALSLFWVDIPGPSANGEMVADQGKTMYEIITDIHQETERRDLSGYFYALGNHGEEAIDTLLYFLDCEDPVKREFAAGQLGRIRDPKAVDPLISALQDENWRVINSSCNALAEIGDQRAVAPIIDLVRKLPPRDRSRYYSVLGRLHAEAAWPYLLKGLEDDRWYVRNAALDALCEINFEKARSHVYTALDDTDYRVKRKAVFILLDRKPEDGLVYLNRVVCDTDFETRFYARQAIKQIEKEYNH